MGPRQSEGGGNSFGTAHHAQAYACRTGTPLTVVFLTFIMLAQGVGGTFAPFYLHLPVSFPTPCPSPQGGAVTLSTSKFRCGSECCLAEQCVARHCHLYPALKRWGPPRRQGLCSHLAHLCSVLGRGMGWGAALVPSSHTVPPFVFGQRSFAACHHRGTIHPLLFW